jgi:hypothetical protein
MALEVRDVTRGTLRLGSVNVIAVKGSTVPSEGAMHAIISRLMGPDFTSDAARRVVACIPTEKREFARPVDVLRAVLVFRVQTGRARPWRFVPDAIAQRVMRDLPDSDGVCFTRAEIEWAQAATARIDTPSDSTVAHAALLSADRALRRAYIAYAREMKLRTLARVVQLSCAAEPVHPVAQPWVTAAASRPGTGAGGSWRDRGRGTPTHPSPARPWERAPGDVARPWGGGRGGPPIALVAAEPVRTPWSTDVPAKDELAQHVVFMSGEAFRGHPEAALDTDTFMSATTTRLVAELGAIAYAASAVYTEDAREVQSCEYGIVACAHTPLEPSVVRGRYPTDPVLRKRMLLLVAQHQCTLTPGVCV